MAAVPQPRSSKVIYLWPEQLQERKANNRFDYGDIEGLGKSILSKGIITPLKVRKTKLKTEDDYPIYEVLVGNRRSKAAKKVRDRMIEKGVDGDFVPAEVVDDTITSADIIAMSVITDEHGKQRNMLEIGHDIQALVTDGLKQKEIAKLIGKSEQYVSDCMLLMEKATPAIVDQIKSGQLLAYNAVEFLKSTPAPEVEEAVKKASKKKEVEEAVTGKASKKKSLKKTEIEEEHGAPMTQKGKKSAAAETSKKTAGSEKTEPKEDATLIKLNQLKDTLKANAGPKKKSNFSLLTGLINYCKGKATALDLLPVFFWDVDADMDERFLADAVKPETEEEEAPAKKPTAKKKEEPAKKSAKAAPAKKAAGKKKVADDDDDAEAYESDNELDSLDDDEDFEE